jgi:hypothetical protein
MSDNKEKWSRANAYCFALGYYNGRSKGVSDTENLPDDFRHYYNLGYDAGVTDYCDFDIPEGE